MYQQYEDDGVGALTKKMCPQKTMNALYGRVCLHTRSCWKWRTQSGATSHPGSEYITLTTLNQPICATVAEVGSVEPGAAIKI